MPKYPYSIRPLKQSSEINLLSEKVKSTGILLRSPHLAESSIEFGLRKKIYSLKTENQNSSIIGVLSKRLSNVEKELHTIKEQLKEANNLLEEKDNEIKNLKARLSVDDKNELVCNAPDKKKNGNSSNNSKTKVVNEKDSIGSFDDEHEVKKVTSSFNSMKNYHGDSPPPPKSQSGSPVMKTSSPPLKRKSKKKDRPKTDFETEKGRDSSSPNMVVLRPGEKKPEYKKLKNNQISDVDTPENQSPTGSDPKIAHLEQENKQLAQKVAELEKFIGEYGLMWVGDKAIGDSNIGSTPTTSATLPSRSAQMRSKTTVKIKQPNLDNIITVITDLNGNVSEQHIVKSPLGAKFQKCDVLELKLYADGMQLEQNPFRKYDTPSAEAFFKDLEDGYYPSELKSKHPQGVIFKVVDKRNIAYEEASVESKPKPFSGKGVKLGGNGKKISITSQDSVASPPLKPPKPPAADKVSISSRKSQRVSYEEINEPPKNPKMKMKKKVQKNIHIAEDSDKSGVNEHWVNKKSPPPSVNMVDDNDNGNPPQIEMPSIPMEINLTQSRNPSPPPPGSAPPPSSFTPAVSLTASKVRPLPQEEPKPQQPTANPSRVFSDQAIYQQNDQDRNRAPINITNITYHEAPVTFQLTPEEAANLPRVVSAGVPSVASAASRPMPTQTSCKCAHEHPHPQTTRSPNEICPGACGQFGVIGAPSKPVLCPCGCGARADLYIHEAPPPAHESRDSLISEDDKKQDFNLTERKLDILTKMKLVHHYDQLTKMHAFACIHLPQGRTDEPLEPLPQRTFPGMTEYQDKISRMAFMRMHHGKEINDAVDGTPAAGKPSGFKNVKVDPYEEFENFTYMGKPRSDKTAVETGAGAGAAVTVKRKIETAEKYKVFELNKKTSETMISVKLHSDLNKKTYLIHVYPSDPIEKIWSILNTSGENYEMVTQVGDKPVLLLDDATLEEQNVKDNADIIVRRSPNKDKKKSALETVKTMNKVIDKKQEKISDIVSKRKNVEKKISKMSQVSKPESVESDDEETSPDKSTKEIKKHKKVKEKAKETNINPNNLPPLKVVSDTSTLPSETIKSPERKKAEEMLEDKYEEILTKPKTRSPKKLSKEDESAANQNDEKRAKSVDIKTSSRKVSSEPIVDKQVFVDHLSSSGPDVKAVSPNKTKEQKSPEERTSISPNKRPKVNISQKNITEDISSPKAEKSRSPKGLVSEAVINALGTLAEKSGSPKGLASEPAVSTEKGGSPIDKREKSISPKKAQDEKSISPKKAPSPRSAKKLENEKTEPTVNENVASSKGEPEKNVLAEKSVSPKDKIEKSSPPKVSEPTKIPPGEKNVSPKKAISPESPKIIKSDKIEPTSTDPTKKSQGEKTVSPKKVSSPETPKKVENEKIEPTSTDPTKKSQGEKTVSPKKVSSPESPKKVENEKVEPTSTDPTKKSQGEKTVSPKKFSSPETPKKVENEKIEPTSTDPTKKSQGEKTVSPKKFSSPETPKKVENEKIEPTSTDPTKKSQGEKTISPKKVSSPETPKKVENEKIEPTSTDPTKKSQHEKSVSPKKVSSPETPKKLESGKIDPTTTEPAKGSQEKSVSPKKVSSPESAKKLESDKIEPTIQGNQEPPKTTDEKPKEKSISPTKPPDSPKNKSEKSSPQKETQNKGISEQKSPPKSKSVSPKFETPQIVLPPEIAV